MCFSRIKFFQKFSFTDLDSKDINSKSVVVKLNIKSCFNKIKQNLLTLNVKKFIPNEEYNELFYVVDEDSEVTILLLEKENGGTIISSHVKSDQINKSYKVLSNVMFNIRELFNNYLEV